MPDREVTFSQCKEFIPTIYNLKIHGCNGWENNLTHVEARETMMQIADHLGYTYTHRSAKKPEPTPQARQDIAATATLHGMGHIWDGEKWKAPQLVLVSGVGQGFDLVDSLRTRITVLTQQAQAQDQTLQRTQRALEEEEARGMGWFGKMNEAADALDLPAKEGRTDLVVRSIKQLQRQLEERKQLAEVQQRANTEMTGTILHIQTALGVEEPFDTEGTGIIQAIRVLKSSVGNTEWADKELNRIGKAVGITEEGECSAAFIVPAIEKLQRQQSEYLDELRTAVGLFPDCATAAQVVTIVKALKSTLDQVYTATGVEPGHPDLILTINQAKEMHERVMHCYFNTCRTLGLAATTENYDKVMPAIEALNARNTALTLDNAGAFAALRDHGHTPLTSAHSLGTLIRDAFGAEAAKVRQARMEGVQQERLRVAEKLWAAHKAAESTWRAENRDNGYTSHAHRLCGAMDALSEQARTLRDTPHHPA